VVGAGLAVVSNELESANHLADGEEADALGEDDAASGELGGAKVAGTLDEVHARSDDASVLDGLPQLLVEALESRGGAGC
jgi:hypothetical protein